MTLRQSLPAAAALVVTFACLLSTSLRAAESPTPEDQATAAELKPKGRLRLLGSEVAPGTRKKLTWTSGQAMEGFVSPVPSVRSSGA